MPVQVSYGNTAITSNYVTSRICAEIGADTHRDCLQVKYKWSDQPTVVPHCLGLIWNGSETYSNDTSCQSVQALRPQLAQSWLSKSQIWLSKMMTKNQIMPSNAPTANRMKIFNTCSPVPTGVLLRHDMMLVRLSGRQSKATRLDHVHCYESHQMLDTGPD